jgi:hypothetical protein
MARIKQLLSYVYIMSIAKYNTLIDVSHLFLEDPKVGVPGSFLGCLRIRHYAK